MKAILSVAILAIIFMPVGVSIAQADRLPWPLPNSRSSRNLDYIKYQNNKNIHTQPTSPTISKPKFIKSEDIKDDAQLQKNGIGICLKESCKFYPFEIIIWHNIVNDYIEDIPIIIYHNDKQQISAVYERKINGEILFFSNTSDTVINNPEFINIENNKITLWHPILAEANSGLRYRQQLRPLPIQVVNLKSWLNHNPKSLVLSKDTGHIRPYGAEIETTLVNTRSQSGNRLDRNELIAGFFLNQKFIAIPVRLTPIGNSKFKIKDENITINKFADNKIEIISDKRAGDAPSIYSSWQAWSSIHPNSLILK